MKNILFSLVLLSGLFLSNGDYLQRDTLSPERSQIKDRYGRSKGYVKKDSLFPDQYHVYDKNGKRVKTIKRDSLNKDTWIIQ